MHTGDERAIGVGDVDLGEERARRRVSSSRDVRATRPWNTRPGASRIVTGASWPGLDPRGVKLGTSTEDADHVVLGHLEERLPLPRPGDHQLAELRPAQRDDAVEGRDERAVGAQVLDAVHVRLGAPVGGAQPRRSLAADVAAPTYWSVCCWETTPVGMSAVKRSLVERDKSCCLLDWATDASD